MAKSKSKAIEGKSVRARTLVVLGVLGVACFAVLITKLFLVQMVDYEVYQQRAVTQQTRNDIITPARGVIYDRNMKELAVSASVETVSIAPVAITSEEQARIVADGLSSILSLNYDEVYQKTQKSNSHHQYIKKRIDKETADLVRAFIVEKKLSGIIYLTDDTKRIYPYGTFASHILGFVGEDNTGLYGIEYQFNENLSGQPGRIIAAKNARSVDMPFKYEQYYDAQDGDSVVLTIDEVIQHYLEKHLDAALANSQAANGVSGIVMDVTTGEILAMASKPDFDLNDPFTITDESTLAMLDTLEGDERKKALAAAREMMWRNKTVADTYEPGSVFKILTGAMGVEEGVVSANDSFYCKGSLVVADRTIGCWKRTGHGSQTFAQGVMNSCNVVFMELGKRLGAANFFKYFQAFGLTQKTGLTLPGEAGGSSVLYHSESNLRFPVQLATSSFGQTFRVTPIQMITAVSAVTNGGTYYQPQIVRQIVGADGTIKQDFTPNAVRQVVTPETSKYMNEVLEMVVSSGTGTNAYVKGYHVAGKTGTSQKIDKSNETGDDTLRIASFLGYAPAYDPKVAVLIIVDEPQTAVRSGGTLAAPYVAAVLADVLPYLNVEPRYTADEAATVDIITPDFTGMTAEEVKKEAARQGISYKTSGDGATVTDQIPAAGSIVPKNVTMVAYMGKERPKNLVKVPNIEGMTLAGIQKLMKNSSFFIRPTGVIISRPLTLSIKQTPEPGAMVEPGTVITVEFLDTSQTVE